MSESSERAFDDNYKNPVYKEQFNYIKRKLFYSYFGLMLKPKSINCFLAYILNMVVVPLPTNAMRYTDTKSQTKTVAVSYLLQSL